MTHEKEPGRTSEPDPLRVCPRCHSIFRAEFVVPGGPVRHSHCPWDGNPLATIVGWTLPRGRRVKAAVARAPGVVVYLAEETASEERRRKAVKVFVPPLPPAAAGGEPHGTYPFDPDEAESLVAGARRLHEAASEEWVTVPRFDAPLTEPWPHVSMEFVEGYTVHDLIAGRFRTRGDEDRAERLRQLLVDLPAHESGMPPASTGGGEGFLHALLARAIDRVERGEGLVAPEHALPVLRAVCDGLAGLHAAGLVHGDLTPRNVCLRFDGGSSCLALLGLGVPRRLKYRQLAARGDAAQPLEALDDSLPGWHAGRLPYMSPEMFDELERAEDRIDERSDFYQFGLLAYELLTGGYPYPRPAEDSDRAWWELVHREESPCRLPRSIPRRLRHLIARCLRKDPARRPDGVTALRAALRDRGLAGWRRRR